MLAVQEKKESCCGCTACVNICPKKAIQMSQDGKGFYYPEIDDNKCINCGLCRKVCNFSQFHKDETGFAKAFAVRHKCEDEVLTSRSGGFSSAMVNAVINREGVCFGAVLTSDFEVVHQKAENKKDCFAFKGSKYVQSRIDESIFSDCKALLDSGRTVLFTGTGCQVHGLLSYLELSKTDHTNLITIDFVCHGVPSPEVWKAYLAEVQRNKKLRRVEFRDKARFGWAAHMETYTYEDGTLESNARWAEMFYQHCLFRESCYACPYTTPYRNSDFTIGDYWGFEKTAKGFQDDKGLSLVIAHTPKAVNLLMEQKDCLVIQETELSKSLQPQLQKPVYVGVEYNRFWRKWISNKERAVSEFFFPGVCRRRYLYIANLGKKIIKKTVTLLRSVNKRDKR